MAKKASSPASPLTFDLPVSLIAKINAAQSKMELGSTSEVVRLALAKFNFERYEPTREEHRQISVRLPADMKAILTRQSRKKKVSVGELLRASLEELSIVKPVNPKVAKGKKKAETKPVAKKAAKPAKAAKPVAKAAATVAKVAEKAPTKKVKKAKKKGK